MADFELIQQRRISGKGVIRIPSDTRKNRLLILYADVIRRPRNESLNFNYLPGRSRYATINFFRNDYVIDTKSVDYLRQSYDGINDISSQNLIAIKCAYDGILETFISLSTAIGGTPGGAGMTVLSKVDLIKDYEYLNLSWDEARIVCFADTAIEFKLYRLIHDTCSPDKDKDKRPPPPPPPPDTVPPGTPIQVDPPYEDGGNPDGTTEPYEDDFTEPPPPPPPPNCTQVIVSYTANRLHNNVNSQYSSSFSAGYPVEDVYISEVQSGGSSIFAVHAELVNGVCTPGIVRRFNRITGTLSGLTYTVTQA